MHKEQLKHVQKGCLERRRQDILSDGSRIKGSHKGWNSLQRVQPSGITVLIALGHDFVLRRNIRVAYSCAAQTSSLDSPLAFLASTYGSHHVSLVAAITALHNETLKSSTALSSLKGLPELAAIHLGEAFGLITSDHASTFGGLLDVKEELTEDDAIMPHPDSLEFEHNSTADLALHASHPILEELRVDLRLLDQPQGAQHTMTTGGTETITATKRKLESMSPADTVHIGGASITTKTSRLLLDVSPPRRSLRLY